MFKFFSDLCSDSSDKSMMRFCMWSAVYMASGIAAFGLYRGVDLYALSTLCGVFLTTAFAGKAIQTKYEASDNKPKGEIK